MTLACTVIFVTTYAMILPAITVDQDTAENMAGLYLEDANGKKEFSDENERSDAEYLDGQKDDYTFEEEFLLLDGEEGEAWLELGIEEETIQDATWTDNQIEVNTEVVDEMNGGNGEDPANPTEEADGRPDEEADAPTEKVGDKPDETNNYEEEAGLEADPAEDGTGLNSETLDVPEDFNEFNLEEEIQEVEDPLLAEEPENESLVYPAMTFSGSTEDLDVFVEAPDGALPKGTSMQLEPVDGNSIFEQVQAQVSGKVTSILAVDITFDFDNSPIQPAVPVKVTLRQRTMELDEESEIMLPNHVLSGYKEHLTTEELVLKSGEKDGEEEKETLVFHVGHGGDAFLVAAMEREAFTYEFEADEFSVYALVGMEMITVPFVSGDGNTYEVTVNLGKEAGVPDNARLEVTEVDENSPEYKEYVSRAAEAIAAKAIDLQYVKLLDISILDEYDNKVKLNAPVTVQIKLMDKEQAEKTTRVVHFVGENETPTVMNSSVKADTVSFKTEGFSIYAIVDAGEENETPPRRRYHFIKLDETTGAIVPYYFYNSAGELVDNQIIKTGDVLEPINTPYIPDERTWIGWRVAQLTNYDPNNTTSVNYDTLSYGREVIFGEPLTVTQKEDVYLIPFYGDYHLITFIDYLFNADKVSGYLIHSKEEVPLGTTYDTTVQTVPSHKSVGGVDEADLVFVGWRLLHAESEMTGFFDWSDEDTLVLKPGITWDQVDPTDMPDGHAVPGVERDSDKFVILIEMDPDQSRDYVLLPVYQKAYWVEYYSAPTGSGATYVAPKHVRVGQTAAAAGAEPTVAMNWRGYEFQYWTTEETFDQDGKPIEFASGNEPARYNFNQILSSDVKLNAYWKKATTTYTVMYWRQQLADDKNLEGDQKHYDYAGQRTGTGAVDSTVTLTTADQNMNDSSYNGANEDYKKYVGFSYAKTDAAEKTVKADGSTVVNVYYDRNLITMNFNRDIEFYTETEDITGELYGLVDGDYVPVTWDGDGWKYSITETHEYLGTRYREAQNNSSGTHYGLVDGELVELRNHGGWNAYLWQYLDSSNNQWVTYNGTMYSDQGTNKNYGLVNGQMVPLTYNSGTWNYTVEVNASYSGEHRYRRSTTRQFTGLYGQLLEKYGYRWPAEYVWRYATRTDSAGMSYLGEFVLPNDVNDSTGKVINLTASGSATNYFDFYLQDPEKTDLTDEDTYELRATGSGDFSTYSIVRFTLSDKYEGYTIQGYRCYTGTGANKRYIDNNIRTASVDDQVVLKGNGVSYNIEVFYKVYSYNITYKDPITREVMSNQKHNYGASISNTGAPTKTFVEGHVPTGYRLITDDEGNIVWFADPSAEVEFNFDRAMPNHDLEVFPGFEPIYYWIKIDPNGGKLSDTESTWFWKRHGDTSVYEYTDVVREFAEDPDGEYYYHYDEFVDPENDVNQYGTRVRKAEYRKISDYNGEGTWIDDSYDGKKYSPSDLFALDGWYEVDIDQTTGSEILIPYHFGSPITHNTTLRAVWIKTGAYSTVYKTEGVDANGNPLFTYTEGGKNYLVTKNGDSYTYKDDNGATQTLDASAVASLTRLTGSNAPTGGRTYEDEADTVILHRPDPPAGYVCTGYYFNGNVYIPGNIFKINSTYDGADGDIDQQFTFYPIYEPITDRDVQITNVYFDPNVDSNELRNVVLNNSIQDYYEDNAGNRYDSAGDGRVQKQSVDTSARTVAFVNRQVNKELTLLGEGTYTRDGYILKGWSLTSGDSNTIDFALGQEHVAADNLSKTGNTDANTLYAVWEIKKYTVTVEKVVETNGDLEWDRDHKFTFQPDFSSMLGITEELQTNFSLTGDEEKNTHIKTFTTQIPYLTEFSITEQTQEKWNVSVIVEVIRDGAEEAEQRGSYNGETLIVEGDMKLIFTNRMEDVAKVTIIKTDENGQENASSEKIINGEIDYALTGSQFTLLRKATSDGHYSIFMQDIAVNRYTTVSLPQGYYQLIETTAPDGYLICNNSWEFVVDYNGNVYAAGGQNDFLFETQNSTSESRIDVKNKTFIIINHPGAALPMTGGTGTLPYTLGGVVLILTSALMYGFTMRRRERRLNDNSL